MENTYSGHASPMGWARVQASRGFSNHQAEQAQAACQQLTAMIEKQGGWIENCQVISHPVSGKASIEITLNSENLLLARLIRSDVDGVPIIIRHAISQLPSD